MELSSAAVGNTFQHNHYHIRRCWEHTCPYYFFLSLKSCSFFWHPLINRPTQAGCWNQSHTEIKEQTTWKSTWSDLRLSITDTYKTQGSLERNTSHWESTHLNHQKSHPTFTYAGCLIVILTIVYYSFLCHTTKGSFPSPTYPQHPQPFGALFPLPILDRIYPAVF